jgi:hypothetical protein
MVGIYKFTNIINNKSYIGRSVNIENRKLQHNSASHNINTKEYNTYFHKAIRKYGIENFKFQILEECSCAELDKREQYWISFYQSNNPIYGYNMTSGGDKVYDNSKTIYQYDNDGKFIQTFKNAYEAGKILGINPAHINGCALHRYGVKRAKGFIFAYEGDDLSWHFDYHSNKVPVYQLDKKGKIINQFNSIQEAGRLTNTDYRNIRKVIQGKRQTAGGYIWVKKFDI